MTAIIAALVTSAAAISYAFNARGTTALIVPDTHTYTWFSASQTLTTSVSLGGFWDSANQSQPWGWRHFQSAPGVHHTAVVFDSWGHLVEASFTVYTLVLTA